MAQTTFPRRCLNFSLKVLGAISGVFLLLALVAWLTGGWIVPPVVSSPAPDDWKQASLFYPEDRVEVEIEAPGKGAEGGVILRGFHFAIEERGPLVVHFAGSGVSLRNTLSSFHFKTQYADLAHRGFSSLAVDYRGVGASGGEPSPTRLGDDARAIWEHALGLVGGDPQRIILRGCSLGTVAIAELLHSGVEPGGVVLIAPVEPSNVALRYGLAWLPGPTAWLAQPFLRDFSAVSVTEEMARAQGPRLAIAHPSDELLGADGFHQLKAQLELSGGQLHEPARTPGGVLIRFGPVVDFMPRHIGLASQASELTRGEQLFLTKHFADQLPMDQRLEQVLAALSPPALERLESTPGAMDRMRWISAQKRFLAPDLAAAVAVAFSRDGLERHFEDFQWPSSKATLLRLERRWNHPMDDLVRLVSPTDPTGAMDPELLSQARLVCLGFPRDDGTDRQARAVLVALASMTGDGTTGPESRRMVAGLGYLERDQEGNVFWHGAEDDDKPKKAYQLDEWIEKLEGSLEPGSTLLERVERCLLKANGHLPG